MRFVTVCALAVALTACSSSSTPPVTVTTPTDIVTMQSRVDDAKKALVAADATWKLAQHAFAEAYVTEKIDKPQFEKFRKLDSKVLAAGRLLRNAVRNWEQTKSAPNTSQLEFLATNLTNLMIDGAKLAAEFNLSVDDLKKLMEKR